MPSFVLDVFGAARMPVVYGTILTAWSAAGVAGPQWVAFLKDRTEQNAAPYAFASAAAFLAARFVLSLALGTLTTSRPGVNPTRDTEEARRQRSGRG
jgi:MFS transporter, OFA family, oxalate/formate antiporter